MLIGEIKEAIENKNEYKIEICDYLPLAKKVGIINGLVDAIIVDENGYSEIDLYKKELLSTYALLQYYTDIEFEKTEDDITKFDDVEYDFVKQKGIYNQILNDDVWEFLRLLDEKLEMELQKRNSISSILNKLGMQLIDKLDQISDPKKMAKMVKEMKKAVDGNPELMNLLQLDKMAQIEKKVKSPKKVK